MTVADLTVLLCDDSILSRKKMRDLLMTTGCSRIIEAADGQAAIDMYKNLKPDIVFMDIVMPHKDGVSALKEILLHDATAYVIMFSAVGTNAHLIESIRSGAKDFLQKPVEMPEIHEVLRTILERLIKEQNNP